MDLIAYADLPFGQKGLAGVYQYRNTLDGKVYVGSATILSVRHKSHLYKLRNGIHPSKHFQNAWNFYGEDLFAHEILEFVDLPVGVTSVEKKAILLPREQYWIDELKAADRKYGYNIRRIAESNLGTKWSDEAKANFSKISTGKKRSESTRDSMKLAWARRKERTPNGTGPPRSQEHIDAARNGQLKSFAKLKEDKALLVCMMAVKFHVEKWPLPQRPPRSAEAIAKQKEAMTGRIRTAEHSAAISAAKAGVPKTLKERIAFSLGHVKRKARIQSEKGVIERTAPERQVEETLISQVLSVLKEREGLRHSRD